MIGRIFDGRYEVLRKVGSGGMADVYLAKDRVLGRQIALKVLSAQYTNDGEFVERFRREASAAASLNHPNVVQVYDKGEAEGTYYIAMEYLPGRSLKEIIVKYAPLGSDFVVSVSRQIVEALRYVHRRDIVHRDIKPQNIIIDDEGRVKVTDFGIAWARGGSSLTEAGTSIGTAHYLSPEQAQGHQVDAASDLYSLGVVMYEMTTGKLPFDGDNSVGIAMQHVNDAPPAPRSLVPEISEDLEAVILRAMAKQQTVRYLTAQAMLDDLWRVQEGKAVDPAPGFVSQSTDVYRFRDGADTNQWAALSMTNSFDTSRGPVEGAALPEDYFGKESGRKKNWLLWGAVGALLIALIVTAISIFSLGVPGEVAVVPNVVGMSPADAETTLTDAGFKFGNGGERPSTQAKGLIGDQDPDSGTKMSKGEEVTVYISSGPGPVEIPNVVGMDYQTATQALVALGLEVRVEEEPTEDVALFNYVQRQEPGPGGTVETGTTVTIWVAVPNDMVLVPNVVGMSRTAAENALTSLGLRANVVEVDSDQPGGTVLTQDPAPNTEVATDSEVTIEVSNAAEENKVYVPAVAQMGLTLTQATNLLAQYHLKVSVEYYTTPAYPPDNVIQQDPAAGTQVDVGSTVKLTVAKAPATTTAPPTTTSTTLMPTSGQSDRRFPDTTESTH